MELVCYFSENVIKRQITVVCFYYPINDNDMMVGARHQTFTTGDNQKRGTNQQIVLMDEDNK